MDILSRNNLQDFCRICLRNLGTTTQQTPSILFGCNLNELPQLFKLVLMLTSLEGIGEHVAFPRRLCQLCYDKLIDIQNFQKLAIQSTHFLSDVLAHELSTLRAKETETQYKHNNKLGNEDDDESKLLLPELLPLLVKPVKMEVVEEEEAQLQDNNIESNTDNLIKSEPTVLNEELIDNLEYTNVASNQSLLVESNDSQDDEGDDADDEEHSLRSGVANSSSSTSTPLRKRDRNKKSLKCPRCEKYVYKQVYLDAHIRAVHEGHEKPFLCDACEKAFTRYNQLREHIRSIHELKKQIMCTFQGCNTSFQSANSLQDHFKVIHAIEASAFGFQDNELNDDIKNICFQCSRQYSSKRALAEHMKRHAQIKEHVCQVCGAAKVTRTELRTHMRTHEPNAEKFKCSMCPQQFNHKNAISRHVRVVHEGQRAYACSYCPKKFGTRNSQTCHERLHTKERPFNCEHCRKSFAQVEGLKSHMKNHNKTLKFKFICSYCQRSFITRKNLMDHELRHTGNKPHICKVCNRGYALVEDLEIHARMHEDELETIIS